MGVDPADCLVIEDAPAGIQSARAGGMKVIGLTSTYAAARLTDADFVVNRLPQIQVTSNGSGMLTVRTG
jgi:sugar-phosphatase